MPSGSEAWVPCMSASLPRWYSAFPGPLCQFTYSQHDTGQLELVTITRFIHKQLEQWFLWSHPRPVRISYRNFRLADEYAFIANLCYSTSNITLLFWGTPLLISCCRILQLEGDLGLKEFNNNILQVGKTSEREQGWVVKSYPAKLRLEMRAPDSQSIILSLN